MLARFFKPTWQHAKPDKRVKAIAKLQASDLKAQPILSQLALEDQDERVRLHATEKLNNLSLLIKISKRDNSPTIQQQALHRISQLLLAAHTEISLEEKLSTLKSLADSGLLTHLALNSNEEALRLQAIKQLSDDTSLAVIAEKSQRAADRTQAASQINGAETLEKVSKFSRNKDKGVFKIVRDKLQSIRDEELKQAETAEKITCLLDAISQLAGSEYFPLMAAKLNALDSDWQTLNEQASHEQHSRYNSAKQACEVIISRQQQHEQALAEQEKVRQRKIERCHALYSELCILKADSEELRPEPIEINQFHTRLQQLATDWEAVSGFSPEREKSGFNKLQAQLGNLLSCYGLYLESCDQFIELRDKLTTNTADTPALAATLKAANRLLSKLSWPKQQPKPDALTALEEVMALAQQRLDKQKNHVQQLQDELSEALDHLQQAVKQGEIRNADKLLKKTEQLSKRLNGNLTPALDKRARALNAELQELRDWQAYAATPKKEQLCGEMEALIESSLPLQERAAQIRKIQKEWKLLDATDSVHSQQLWKRFKSASDQAYAPCDQYFSEQRDQRRQNLQKRQETFEGLSILTLPGQPSNDDWKHYEAQIKAAKQAWRSYTPVDRAPGKKLQSQFDQLLRDLEQPLKDYRTDNAQQKRQLVEQTDALLSSDDKYQATETVKTLQQAWKQLGPAPRNLERKLWSQFRENCNDIFESYYATSNAAPNDSRQRQADSGNSQLLSQFTETCAELETLINSGYSLKQLQSKVNTAQRQVAQLEAHQQTLNQQATQTLRKATTLISKTEAALDQFNHEPFTTLEQQAELCEQIEQAILDEVTEETLTALIKSGEQLYSNQPTCDDPLQQAMQERYTLLCRLSREPDLLEDLICEQEQRLRHLCIRLEIATSQPSPLEDQALRMEYQMERLQQALAEQQQQFNLAEIKRLEFEWMCIPFAAHFEELHERFEQQLTNIL